MSNPTPAQEEFADLLAKNSTSDDKQAHPEDRESFTKDAGNDRSEQDEEGQQRGNQIDAAMRAPALNNSNHVVAPDGELKFPPPSFDRGRSTGVKGVIADARSYENARRTKWIDRVRAARRSVFGLDGLPRERSDSEGSAEDPDETSFLQQWRENRRRELETETRVPAVRNRRTSPSVRTYGRLDEVDAIGYLDAIEKVGRETVVVVFVYDRESEVSEAIESALLPLVSTYPVLHFVKVHYREIEFDNAGVPAILAYRNQGDLFANLTSIIDIIPETEDCDSDTLQRVFSAHGII